MSTPKFHTGSGKDHSDSKYFQCKLCSANNSATRCRITFFRIAAVNRDYSRSCGRNKEHVD